MSIGQISTTDSTLPEITDQGSNTELDKMAFLKLLTVQLANQDPLDPMDSAGMAEQQASFAQVEQLMNLNEKMEGFMQSQEDVLLGITGAFNTLESASFLGKDVAFYTDELTIGEDGTVPELFYDLTQDALVGYTVRDSNGLVIKTTESLVVDEGERIPVGWDGTNEAGEAVGSGKYLVSLNVQNTSGQPMTGKTYGEVMVRAIDYRNGSPEISLLDGRTLSMSEILALSENLGE